MKSFSTILLSALLLVSCSAFAPANSVVRKSVTSSAAQGIAPSVSSTQLCERQWNFNETGRSPWGLKKNAEIWNGRLAQMAFTIVLLQELITGKGVVKGFQDGDFVNIAFVGMAVGASVGLSIWLAIQGTEKYFEE
uniref:Uncharacterized protein n=1 Tax=Leptocylindrus danicus TaxID=163516 RepID=A0A7S2PHX2_9STRA|mmetsp:Transcript_32914/g.47648  ORF Transcript_32914/g.47648 Transcript_32914/m.47648 type:complete len:136 (+) Transcript_32914:64-471(+)